ncbi:chaplin [Kitasatospora sp. NBC_01287]|uniref:chaplin n=1 Tax=Kitasatospora sp. NBC_01287 TaxID=2903573 RepID=UPI00225742DE|nr:chaplin [Kitasatospora sp. NBC_01287]MCX4747708.1 chaplin [Kitasatospora sp. NBC_01287]
MKDFRRALGLACAAGALVLGGAGAASADNSATATGVAVGSPGILSGNVIQVPVNIPVNICGNSIGVISALNPAFGNECTNG